MGLQTLKGAAEENRTPLKGAAWLLRKAEKGISATVQLIIPHSFCLTEEGWSLFIGSRICLFKEVLPKTLPFLLTMERNFTKPQAE